MKSGKVPLPVPRVPAEMVLEVRRCKFCEKRMSGDQRADAQYCTDRCQRAASEARRQARKRAAQA